MNNTKKMTGTKASLQDILSMSTTVNQDFNLDDIINQGKVFMKKTRINWFFALIPIDRILTNMLYQRPTEAYRVNKIKKEFNWGKVDPKCVNYRPKEKMFACMDGCHTLEALKELGFKFMPCKVFIGMSYQEEAIFFSKQNDNVKRLSNMDTYRANLEAGEHSALMIRDTTKNFGVEIAQQAGYKKCRSIRMLTKIYQTYRLDGLWFAFELIRDAGWEHDPKAYTEPGLNVGYSAYPLCLKKNGLEISKTKYNLLIKALKNYPTSTKFVDEANYKYGVTVTYHPGTCVKELVTEIMDTVNEQYQQIVTQVEKIKKVKEGDAE